MFSTDLERKGSVEGPGGVTLVYAQTSLRAASSFGGGGYRYRHPVAVKHQQSAVEVPIRDHLMTVRLAMFGLLVAAVFWRLINGR
jgi:hypothetical protein